MQGATRGELPAADAAARVELRCDNKISRRRLRASAVVNVVVLLNVVVLVDSGEKGSSAANGFEHDTTGRGVAIAATAVMVIFNINRRMKRNTSKKIE